MDKIQLESGPASSATHRLTQPSTTLNRRYVTRPTNLAIEEAARSAAPADDIPSTPSRLVNLRVHSADLLAATQQPPQPKKPEEPIIRTVIELGGTAEPESAETMAAPAPAPEVNITPVVESAPEPIMASEPISTPESMATFEPAAPALSHEPAPVTPTSEPIMSAAPAPISAQPSASAAPAVIDPRDLAMNIAADYAAASMSAVAVAEPAAPVSVDTYVGLDTTSSDSLDAIAQAAASAIASIRTATEPEEISEQIASLRAFAENIRANSTVPEMTELSDTIEKFISVAEKSTKIKESSRKKVALSSKASRAADKVTKSTVKVINRAKPAAAPSSAKIAKGKKPAASRPAPKATLKTTSKAAPRPAARMSARPVSRVAKPSLDQDQALRRALRSVAAMEDEPDAQPVKYPVRRKGNVKRFALAFVCAVVCVAGVTYFVGTNIPDISVRVAAMQTGVEASYPSYIPRDYSLKGISSESGKITINFEGPDRATFTLTEEKSSWDSTTLLRNYVEPTWRDNYTSTHEQGITIYVSGSNAAWVNGGVLYKINSTGANLTNKQLRNIVTSM